MNMIDFFYDTHTLYISGELSSLTISGRPTNISITRRIGEMIVSSRSDMNRESISDQFKEIQRERKTRLNAIFQWHIASLGKVHIKEKWKPALIKSLSIMKSQIYTPEGRIGTIWSTPDRWPHRKMWLWDSVFHAMGWRHLDHTLARMLIRAVIDTIDEDGFVPHCSAPDESSSITQPPLLAYGVWQMVKESPDQAWVKELIPPLKKYLTWNERNRDRDGNGLLEWFIEGNPQCRSGESGMDNSPRFDSATQIDGVDFNSFMSLEWESMAKLARLIGENGKSEEYQARHDRYNALINHFLWDEEKEFYIDYDGNLKKGTGILASSGFLPLICGAATGDMAQSLVNHLRDPEMFGTAFPVPSIAAKDREHYQKDMWRGPTWININWLIALGLERYGFNMEAQRLREKSIGTMVKYFDLYSTFFEFYDDRDELPPPRLNRKGSNIPDSMHQVLFDYGWSATLFLDMIQNLKPE